MSLRIAFIGHGASGRVVAEMVAAGAAGDATITGILVRQPERYAEIAGRTGWPFLGSLDALLAGDPDVVVELAGHEALAAYGEAVLRAGRTLVTISAGWLSDEPVLERLSRVAKDHGARLVLPSGAIGGLDAIASAAVIGLDRVRHTVRKPPIALLDADEAAKVIASGQPRELYAGPAREAVKRFPQNVNVVAMVSLAGVGLDRTEVAVVADPTVDHNTHEVTAEGPSGTISITVRNVPSPDNPKTGRIVAGSVIRSLRRLTAAVQVG